MKPPTSPERDATLQWLGETYAASLARALESMSGESPEVSWKQVEAPAGQSLDDGAVLWWEQEFDLVPEPALWIGIPGQALEEMGARVLSAAGVEQLKPEEVRNTALEVGTQALAAMAQALGERQQCAVNATGGRQVQAAPEGALLHGVWIRFADTALAPIQIAFAAQLAGALEDSSATAGQAAAPAASPARGGEPEATGEQTQVFKTLDLLRDVELPVSVSFGRTQMPLEDVLKLTAGSVIELDRSIDEPVALIVNDTVVALGEVVVIEGNYGLKIRQIMSRERLLRSSGVA